MARLTVMEDLPPVGAGPAVNLVLSASAGTVLVDDAR